MNDIRKGVAMCLFHVSMNMSPIAIVNTRFTVKFPNKSAFEKRQLGWFNWGLPLKQIAILSESYVIEETMIEIQSVVMLFAHLA